MLIMLLISELYTAHTVVVLQNNTGETVLFKLMFALHLLAKTHQNKESENKHSGGKGEAMER